MHNTNDRPVVGELWQPSSFETFVITDVKIVNGDCWIHYKKLSDNSKYSCLEESFTFRFYRVVNAN